MAERSGFTTGLIRACLQQRLLVVAGLLLVLVGGLQVAPFPWELGGLPRDPIAVDAIPDLGENQQIVFTEWPGRSPQDVEDQVTYPLTVSLLGVPGVRTVRSLSMLGFSTVYVIFEEDVEFYWSRSRVLEKLASLGPGTLPESVHPTLGPDSTPLGQVFWYTLEGRDPDGRPTGGWGLHELRSIQDWIVRYALAAAEGISEIASVGGFVQEYQIDVDPDAMSAHGVTLEDVFGAVRMSNLDVGARTIEVNRVEYVIRGLGFVETLADLEETVVRVNENVPIYVRDVAQVALGPALRRGALDKGGAEAAGGVAVVRYGYNPLAAIENLKAEVRGIAPGLPSKVLLDDAVSRVELEDFARTHGFESHAGTGLDHEAWLRWLRATPRSDWPDWATTSQVTIVPFYDRTELIQETLGTLSSALLDELLVTVLVVVLMLAHLGSSLLVGLLLPLSVGGCFLLMKLFGVEANVVALAGIAIAIGTMVDMGIVLTENVVRRLGDAPDGERRTESVLRATGEVGGAVLTSVATTVVGFLPVFVMTGAEGKLFRPLAFTKTFALVASVVLALTVLPVLALALLRRDRGTRAPLRRRALQAVAALIGLVLLARHWSPLGAGASELSNLLFVAGLLLGLLFGFWLVHRVYARLLAWALEHKLVFLALPAGSLVLGLCIWLGFERVFSAVPGEALRRTRGWQVASESFPGLGKEFMPDLDEGSFLWMPSTMAHASIGEALEVLQIQDAAIATVPEVAEVVGKLGRADSALDPAPIGMFETVISYVPEWGVDEDGDRVRNWRDHISSPDDIWEEIVRAAELPGTTSAPRLQPIAARLVMLQSGMRAPMGIKVRGPDLATIEAAGLELERFLREVPGVQPDAVLADRIVGKPYLEIDLDREALARHGLHISTVQEVIEVAIGGKTLTTTVEGRERYPVRVRYSRELRDDLTEIGRILVPTEAGATIPLNDLAEIRFVRGPQAIKSEDTFLIGYVIFDKRPGWAEVDVVEAAEEHLRERTEAGELQLPPGVSYVFTGTYENQLHAQRTLAFVLPVALALIFLILHLYFRSLSTTAFVASAVLVAWSGGFVLLWLYGRPWFLDFDLFGTSMRELFQIEPRNLSVAVWVGFLALFGIATDDGVVMSTYLDQTFERRRPRTVAAVRAAVLEAGGRRVRPCLMTTATTLLALLPVLTSTGRGSDILVPMAIPTFGGMALAVVTMFVVPVLVAAREERRLRRGGPSPLHPVTETHSLP
jgi:Cu(I)/Ag(I) efflux system membrane protein CusA/SilA